MRISPQSFILDVEEPLGALMYVFIHSARWNNPIANRKREV